MIVLLTSYMIFHVVRISKDQNATTVKDGMGVSGNDRCDIGRVPGKLDASGRPPGRVCRPGTASAGRVLRELQKPKMRVSNQLNIIRIWPQVIF